MIKIVPINFEHIAEYHLALNIVAKEKKYLAWFKAPPIETTREFVKKNIENGVSQFVALYGTKVVGWCDICPSNKPAFAHAGTLGMALIPEYRGRGIGKKLLLAALKKAKANGIERVELLVYKSNDVAKTIYEKIGFKIEGIRQKSMKIDGKYYDDYIMSLFLDEIELF